MKTVAASLLLGCVVLLVPSCGGRSGVTVIKLAHGLDRTHPVHRAMEYMAQRVAEKSNGTMRIDIYPSGQLGTERENVELLQIGSLGISKVSTSVMEGFAPSYKVFSLPYLFRDREHRYRALDGEIGRRLLDETRRYRILGLCYYDAGTRSFYTKSKPILSPEDLAGLKIRTQESTTSLKMVQALGGSATPIAWGELYTALQQGVVDGAENNPPSFYLSRHYEVCRHYSLDEHTAVPDVLMISLDLWERLRDDQRTILREAALESQQYQRVIWKEASDHALEEVQKAGVTLYYPDKRPFQEKVQPLYEEYRSQPEIYRLIQEIKEVR